MASFRFERLRRRLARRRGGEEPDGEGVAAGEAEDESSKGVDAAGTEPPDTGYVPAKLGDLRESRREAIGRRMRSARGRFGGVRAGMPDLGRLRSRIGAVVGGAATTVGSALRSLGELVSRGASRIADLWFLLPLVARQRIAAGAGLLAALAFGFFVLVPIAPCAFPGGDRCPPADDAIALVPADVGAYLHVNLDPDTDQFEAASEISGRLPEISASATSLLSLSTGRQIDYGVDIQPWSDGELALVLDADGLDIGRMLMVEVANTEGAVQFGERILAASPSTSELDGVEIKTDSKGMAAAIDQGFLLVGDEALVRASIELAVGESLAVDRPAEQALESLPEDALLDAYLSAEYAGALTARAELGPFDTFISSASSEGVAGALSFSEDSIEAALRSVQDPELADTVPDFFSALPLFEPELTGAVNEDALVFLDVGDPGASAATLIGQAADTAPDLFSGLKSFNRRLRDDGGVNIERDVLPLLEGESALTVEPQAPVEEGDEGASPGVIGETGIPYLALLASGVDAERARRDLAALQVPIAEAIDPSQGQAPFFETGEVAGVEAPSLTLSPVVELTYASFEDKLVVGTSPAAIERTVGDGPRLADSDQYKSVTAAFPEQVSLLLYLDFRDLLALGERLFLAEDPGYARFALDLRTLQAAALAVTRTRTELATDVKITVGEPEAPDPASSTLEIEPG